MPQVQTDRILLGVGHKGNFHLPILLVEGTKVAGPTLDESREPHDLCLPR